MYPEIPATTINDTCILFDLIDLELIDLSINVQNEVITSPFVLEEIKKPHQKTIINNLIADKKIHIDSKGDIFEIRRLMKAYKGLTFTDCSILELANRNKGTIITSDNGIRKTSKKVGIEARGILLLFDTFRSRDLLPSDTIIKKLNYLKQINSHCPKKEIENFIGKINKKNITYI
jgi:predicted nucleic acid-binding protein